MVVISEKVSGPHTVWLSKKDLEKLQNGGIVKSENEEKCIIIIGVDKDNNNAP